MKKNYSHKKDNVAVMAQSLNSGKNFVQLRLQGVKDGLILPTNTATRRQLSRSKGVSLKDIEIDFLQNCMNYVVSNPTFEVLSNSSVSAMKATVTLCGHHLNPLQQAKDSSRRVVEYRHSVTIMHGLFEESKKHNFKNSTYNYDGDQLHAYAGVFSFTNSDKGRLGADVTALNDMASKFWKKLKDANNRTSSLNRLNSIDGSYASPVGMLLSNEMTANTDKMQALDGKGIFHPHIHFILFTDKELGDDARNEMYAIWNDVTGVRKTDIQAFSFAPVYSKSTNKDGAISNIIKEVTKYLMDPSKWDLLALKDDDTKALRQFKIELFSEYFNAYESMKRVRTYGLLRDAQSYINRFSDFENASIYKNSDILSDILTQLNEMKYDVKARKYNFKHVRLLSDDEILHENKTFLSNVLVSDLYKQELDQFVHSAINYLTTDKDKLFATYFKQTQYHTTLTDLISMFDDSVQEIRHDRHKMPLTVFNPQSYKNQFGESFEIGNYEHFVNYRLSKMNDIENDSTMTSETASAIYQAIESFGKACDVEMLKNAVISKTSLSGNQAIYSRKEIDIRILEKRKEYRDSVICMNGKPDMQMSQLFYQNNGMNMPMDGRTHEVVSFYVNKKKRTDLFDLFRVPQGARKQVEQGLKGVTINGVAV